ncbi:hypothetical protein F503_04327 [Ophiostoma piceae UAMH 11346]|uniref:Formylmethionine deformylase-like protein n=1 Tax=Ophiostoma piceae (strain UAMH 11346) TaxID=1262450 RepID=S3D5T1_OPHP1|nr:hypothetical protein F503_04327 [Ophiostoma piceae UAMH 11346]
MASCSEIGTELPTLEHHSTFPRPPLDERHKYAQTGYESVRSTHASSIYNNSNKSSDKSTLINNPNGENAPERRPLIHWRYPALTLLLFVAGILLAVGHDIYYGKLDGQRADLGGSTTNTTNPSNIFASLVGDSVSQQIWANRIGTGLAFLCKTALSIVVGLVGAQQIWYTLRQKDASIYRIDGMFQLIENPLALLNWGLLWHAKLLSVLALVSWLLPLASIVTPSTLSVQSRPQLTTVEMTAPGLNFSDSMSWISTEAAGYVTGANFDISTLFSNLYSSVSFVPMKSAPFANSSYGQTLYGPSYKCLSLNEALAADITPSWTIANPKGEANTTYKTFEDAFYGELGVPRVHDVTMTNSLSYNNLIYNAVSPGYMFNTILISAGGTNALWDAQGKNNDTFVNTTTLKEWSITETAKYYSGPYGSNLVCQLYNTSFDVTFKFENGVQSIIEQEIKYLEPQAWNAQAGTNTFLGPCSGVNTSFPLLSESDPWSFTSRGNCNQTSATYYVMHLLFTYLLTADLSVGADGSVVMENQATIPLLQSPFIHCPDFYNSSQFRGSEISTSGQINPSRCRNGTLASAIEDMSRNFTYSLLAFDGWGNYSNIDSVLVTYSESHLFFTYARGTLWAVYGAAIGATLLTLFVGVRALLHNGVVSSTSFSSILLTTRNPQLHDKLIQGAGAEACHPMTSYTRSLGAQPIDRDIGELRLRFGYIDNGSGAPQAGFGVEDTVQPFR